MKRKSHNLLSHLRHATEERATSVFVVVYRVMDVCRSSSTQTRPDQPQRDIRHPSSCSCFSLSFHAFILPSSQPRSEYPSYPSYPSSYFAFPFPFPSPSLLYDCLRLHHVPHHSLCTKEKSLAHTINGTTTPTRAPPPFPLAYDQDLRQQQPGRCDLQPRIGVVQYSAVQSVTVSTTTLTSIKPLSGLS